MLGQTAIFFSVCPQDPCLWPGKHFKASQSQWSKIDATWTEKKSETQKKKLDYCPVIITTDMQGKKLRDYLEKLDLK